MDIWRTRAIITWIKTESDTWKAANNNYLHVSNAAFGNVLGAVFFLEDGK